MEKGGTSVTSSSEQIPEPAGAGGAAGGIKNILDPGVAYSRKVPQNKMIYC